MHRPDPRRDALLDWLQNELNLPVRNLAPASSDASFRRYFRFEVGSETRIAMDAPPPQENIDPFLNVAEILRSRGVCVPEIHAAQREKGFIVLGDFGQTVFLDVLQPENVDALYAEAMLTLLRLQSPPSGQTPETDLPRYDEALLRRELGVFREWCLEGYLGLTLDTNEQALLDETFDGLVASALSQPTVLVHRDFHSRNLMLLADGTPGVLDFQDAVIGPVTYDLASLLRDCYIAWPQHQVSRWLHAYQQAIEAKGLLEPVSEATFRRWFDLMGMQRHLKAVGIFCRLKLRDGKPGYIKDIPRTLGHILDAARDQSDLAPFATFLTARILPAFLKVQQQP